jgi:hypothetical protein
MALARFGGGVSELRGSIAGNVYSRSKAGAIVRNRQVPTNPNTVRQGIVRGWMQTATDGFKALTPEEVTSWNDFASTQIRFNRLGEPYTPSGKQIFTESYLNGLSVENFTPPDLPALESDPNLPNLLAGVVNITTGPALITELELAGWSSDTGDRIVVQATPQMLPSINNVQKYMRQVFNGSLADPTNILAGYTAKYPTTISDPSPGSVIHFRASAVNLTTGLASAWINAKQTVPPLTP